MGRPKLEPATTQRIVDLIRAGNYLEVAATATGIHQTTLYRWMRHGRDQKRGRYRKFLSQVEKAQAEAESLSHSSAAPTLHARAGATKRMVG